MIHERRGGQPLLDAGADGAGAVAGVEPGGQVAGRGGASSAASRSAGDVVPTPADADPVEPAEQQGGRGGEPHLRVRRRRRRQPAEVPLEDLQAARLVAGQRAERDVVGDRAEVGEVAAQAPVRAPVGVGRLGQPAGAQVRPEQLGQDRLRLLDAGQPAGQHRRGQRDRLLVAAPGGQVLHLGRRVAADAVGVVVARRGRPPVEPVLGGRVADVLGHAPIGTGTPRAGCARRPGSGVPCRPARRTCAAAAPPGTWSCR